MSTDLQPRFGPVVYDYEANLLEPLFCGPGAISVLTGHPARTVERYAAFLRGNERRRITGMGEGEIINILEAYGLVPVKIDVAHVDGQHPFRYTSGGSTTAKVRQWPTFIRWLRDTTELRGDDVYLVITSRHVLVARGDLIVDNMTKFPQPYEDVKHYRRAWVRSAYCIMQEPEPCR